MLFFVITKPMSIILDWMLGREVGTIHSRTVRGTQRPERRPRGRVNSILFEQKIGAVVSKELLATNVLTELTLVAKREV